MAANIPQVPASENVSTTLSAGITDSAGTMTVADASNLTSPCYLVIDRVDAAGTVKDTSLWEYVKVTNIAGNDLTITRGQGGSTQQSHSSGAVVEAVITAAHFEDWYNALNPEHTASGGHVITSTMTVAGMNLASVATISSAGIGSARVVDHLNASGASLSGFGFFPTFFMPNNVSAATTSLGRPLSVPRTGLINWVSVTLRSPVSSASIIFDVNKNFVSIFDAGTRVSILGGGTFASTASIATKSISAGNTLSVDVDAGGQYSDATLTVGIY